MLDKLEDRIVIICDTFDMIPLASQEELLEKFNFITKHDNSYIIASSEICCWPNKLLMSKYPYPEKKYRYLNSGFIMGSSKKIHEIITKEKNYDIYDDQLYYTNRFLEGDKIIIDYDCELSQTLNLWK